MVGHTQQIGEPIDTEHPTTAARFVEDVVAVRRPVMLLARLVSRLVSPSTEARR